MREYPEYIPTYVCKNPACTYCRNMREDRMKTFEVAVVQTVEFVVRVKAPTIAEAEDMVSRNEFDALEQITSGEPYILSVREIAEDKQ